MACQTEASDLPLLTGCPGNNEFFIVGNAAGGKGVGGYGRRLYSDIKTCIAGALSIIPLQFTVGDVGAPILEGATTLEITVAGAIQDSEIIILDNNFMEPDLTTQISYTASYTNPAKIVITFNQGVLNGQQYYIKYAKI